MSIMDTCEKCDYFHPNAVGVSRGYGRCFTHSPGNNIVDGYSIACKFFVPKLPPLKENEARIIPVKKPYIEQHEDQRMFIEHDKYGCVSAYFVGKADDYQHLSEFTARRETNQEKALTEHLMGLAGESGEAIDILKKHLFQGHDLDKEHLAEELGDVAWYLAMAAHELGYSLSDIFRLNIEKLIARYPNGFDPERSIKRDE